MEGSFFKFEIFSDFPEIIQGISTRQYGNMSFRRGETEKAKKNREQFFKDLNVNPEEVVVADLIHGNNVLSVDTTHKGKGALNLSSAIKDSDGLITKNTNLFLMVTIADCFPLMAYDPGKKVVGLAHLGWRGVLSGIIPNFIEKFKAQGSSPENLVIGVGPGICQRHFVVKTDVLNQFLYFDQSSVFVRNKDGYVDLRKAITNSLYKSGINKNNLEISQYCPVCSNNLFGSHRVEQENAPISAAIIGLKG